jgi:hypothetical protein
MLRLALVLVSILSASWAIFGKLGQVAVCSLYPYGLDKRVCGKDPDKRREVRRSALLWGAFWIGVAVAAWGLATQMPTAPQVDQEVRQARQARAEDVRQGRAQDVRQGRAQRVAPMGDIVVDSQGRLRLRG